MAHGSMAVNFNLPLLVTTDVEPDDVAALILLLKHVPHNNVLIVVGEHRNLQEKCCYLQQLLQADVRIVAGTPTADAFPVGDVEVKSPFPAASIESFVGMKEVNVVALKPIRDLLHVHYKSPDLFRNCHLYLYGSYNLRSVKDHALKRVPKYVLPMFRDKLECETYLLLKSFKSTLLLELRPSLAFERDDCIQFSAALQQLIVRWNKKMYNTATAQLEEQLDVTSYINYSSGLKKKAFPSHIEHLQEDDPQLHRRLMLLHRLVYHGDSNMAMADVALVVCMLHPNQVSVKECGGIAMVTNTSSLRQLIVQTVLSCCELLAQ